MSSERDAFLDVAAELAHRVAATAVWSDGRCNWLGVPRDHGARTRTIASLGADLYGGTSGVALFLAEMAIRLDDDQLRVTAEGAIRHALDHACRIEPEHRDGLYLGPIGVAYAAARVGELVGSAASAGTSELLRTWRRGATRSASADLMSGCAGAVAGLLALTGTVDEPWLVTAATRVGDDLLARARTTAAGSSWPLPGQRSMHHLCGIAHGAAGVGLALAELFAVTGQDRFARAAARAFDYERSWLDPVTGTWPDLRGVGRAAGRDAPLPTGDSWCNGAAGAALSRLRSADLLGSAALYEEAELALVACERRGSELLTHVPVDLCLCHGAAGTGDVLLSAAAGPDDRRARLAREIGRCGLDYVGGPWAETPSLFTGLAGVGLFYLRLSDPAVATPLLIALTPAPARP